MNKERNRVKAAMLAVFFVTGASGLVYEVVAARLLRIVMGNTTFAVTAVLCAFMGGLAIGSVIGGRIAERRNDLLRVFAVLQFVIAAYFFVLPWLIEAIGPLYRIIHRNINVSFYVFSLIRFFFSALLLVVPCTLMGATLPILSRYFARSPEQVGRSVGMLYAVNTVGGALGAWGAGFVLMPAVGVRASLWLACGISVLAGVVVWRLRNAGCGIRDTGKESTSNAQRSTPNVQRGGLWIVLVAYGMAGVAALTYEVAWTRVLTMLIGCSVYAFSLMLTAFILGLGFGSMLMARLADRLKRPLAVLALIETAAGFSALMVVPFVDRLPFQVTRLMAKYGGSFITLQWVEFGLVLLIMLAPTLLMGAAFPVAGRIVAERDGTTGRSIGMLCSSNTLGCIIGAFFAGFILVPWIGIERTIYVAVFINVLVGCVFIVMCRRVSWWTRFVVPVLILSSLCMTVLRVPAWDVSRMTFGPYVEARRLSEETIKSYEKLEDRARRFDVIYHEEGVSTTVTVKEDLSTGDRGIFVNGKPDASSSGDLPTQIMVAELPLLLHHKPDSALVVGLASGISLGSASLHPLETLDCVEISPEMLRACRYFDNHNYRVMMEPDVRIIIDDARSYLALADRKYDVIISQPSNPWISGISDLFTKEFFELCRRKLSDGGIMCAWVESYTIDEKNFRSIVRTFQSVFPEVSIWSPMAWDFMMIGSKSKLNVDIDSLTKRMMAPEVANDLSRISVFSPADLLGNLVMGNDGVKKMAEGVPIHTDDNSLLEFSSPWTVVRNEGRWALSGIMEKHRAADFSFVVGADKAMLKLLKQESSRRVWARGHVVQGSLLLDEGRRKEALAELNTASLLSPGDRVLRRVLRPEVRAAATYVQRRDFRAARALYREVVDIDPGNIEAQYGLGFALEQLGRLSEAMQHYLAAVEGNPARVSFRNALAGIALKLGKVDVVIEQYRKVLAIEPRSAEVLNNLAWLLASFEGVEEASLAEAVSMAERACLLTGCRNVKMLETLARIYGKAGRTDDAVKAYSDALILARKSRDKNLELHLQMAIEELKK